MPGDRNNCYPDEQVALGVAVGGVGVSVTGAPRKYL